MAQASPLLAELREERAAMQAFLDLLHREQECLLSGDADGVGTQVEHKTACLRRLAGYAERRRVFLQAQQLSPDRQGMAAWLDAQENPAALAAAWQDLLEVTHQACRANDTNGILIATRLQANQQALSVLVTAARGGQLYGRNGQAVGSWDPRRLGAA